MNTLQALEKFPGHIARYFWGLLGAVVDDYALITLTIFSVLLAFTANNVLLALTAFFGAYFVLQVIGHVIGNHAQAVANAGQIQAQATMQLAAALAQPPSPAQQSTMLETDAMLDPNG